MAKVSKIKAGYRITSVSWENDADNYRTLRVLESMKIEYFPEDVVIEDVTNKFFK